MTAFNKNIPSNMETSSKVRETVGSLDEFNALLERKYPRLRKEGFSEAVTLLPSGQLVNLWMTLHHNLYESCIKKGLQTSMEECRTYFVVVSDCFCQFLSGIKIVEPSLTVQTMEKISTMMSKFSNECLASLAALIVDHKHDEEIVHWFLKLAFAWSELHGILLHYHTDKYKNSHPIVPVDTSPLNLSYLHPYLSSEEWQQLVLQIETFAEPSKALIVDLVAQKLKYLTLFEMKNGTMADSLHESHIRNLSKFLWTKLEESSSDFWREDVYSLVSRNMDESGITEIVQHFVKQLHLFQNQCPNSDSFPDDKRFHYSLVFETINELLRKLIKLKFLRKSLKHIRRDILSDENRKKLIFESSEFENFEAGKTVLSNLLAVSNDLIQTINCDEITEEDTTNSVFLENQILPYLKFLTSLPIEEYPKILKTILFLSMMPATIVCVKLENKKLLDLLVCILRQSSMDFVGNEYMFSIRWTQCFKWFCVNVDKFSVNSKRQFTWIILQNIYLSAKAVEDFDDDFQSLTSKFKLTSSLPPVALDLLEFLTQVLEKQTKSKTKSKMTPQLRIHIKKLTSSVIKSLKKVNLSKDITKTAVFYANIFHSISLLPVVHEVLHDSESKDDPKDIEWDSYLKCIIQEEITVAIDYLESCNKKGQVIDIEEDSSLNLELSRRYALSFLQRICKSKEFPIGFITKVWKVHTKNGYSTTDMPEFGEIPILCARDIYSASNTEEFQKITLLITNEMETQSTMEPYDTTKLEMVARLLQEILDVELTPEKKTLRRATIENILYTSLFVSAQWNSSYSSVTKVILPFIQFQISLVRRRNAMCSTNALSLCLTSITSVPLNEITDIKLYKKTFRLVGELLNSFTIHRLDVLSFRIHLYLQCFQYLVEAITIKADQKNKLTDDEILDLRSCAHSVERICQSAKLSQKEFSRVSPYFIAILMRQFEVYTVYPAVKDPLLSGCYKLLDLCDNYGMAQLNSMFTLGSREIFKTVYDVYKKFYRYTGKV